jgi:mRNA interferase MazF
VNEIRQGDVFWIDFGPPSGSEPGGRRPCAVVQNDFFNRSRIATTVVCVITSNVGLGDAPGNVLLQKGEANLPKPSVVNVSQIVTVNKSELLERIGRLKPAAIEKISQGLHLLFERI